MDVPDVPDKAVPDVWEVFTDNLYYLVPDVWEVWEVFTDNWEVSLTSGRSGRCSQTTGRCSEKIIMEKIMFEVFNVPVMYVAIQALLPVSSWILVHVRPHEVPDVRERFRRG